MASQGLADVSVAVFCQNESARIGQCLASIQAAAAGMRMQLSVIVNGSTDGSAAAAAAAARACQIPAEIFTIAFGDKSNAINQALYTLSRPAALHVYLDGYSIISPLALRALSQALRDQPHAVAATGVAGNGRTMQAATAETLAQGGRLHGQLHAFRPEFVDRLTASAYRLPVGLYRGDGLLGSMACHNLDALGSPFDGHRIAGAAEATYLFPQLSPFRPGDIRRQFRRKIRQMRGLMENAAIKSLIYAGGYGALPAHADDMIAAWLADHPPPATSAADRVFMHLALRQHRAARRPEPAELVPVRQADWP
jgi:glycosyltransferase involved in cell wall biosynthesis